MSPLPKKPDYDPESMYDKYISNVYFGDAGQVRKQAQVMADKLSGPGKVYLIYGPVRTGKGTLPKQGVAAAKRKGGDVAYQEHVDEDYKGSEGHHLLVTYPGGYEQMLPQAEASIKSAQEYLAQHPGTSVIIEAIKDEPPIPSLASARQKEVLLQEQEDLDRIANMPNVVVLQTKHSVDRVRDALWDLHATISKDCDNVAPGLKREHFPDVNSKELDDIFDALAVGNRAKYDAAFAKMKQAGAKKST